MVQLISATWRRLPGTRSDQRLMSLVRMKNSINHVATAGSGCGLVVVATLLSIHTHCSGWLRGYLSMNHRFNLSAFTSPTIINYSNVRTFIHRFIYLLRTLWLHSFEDATMPRCYTIYERTRPGWLMVPTACSMYLRSIANLGVMRMNVPSYLAQ